MSTKHQGKAAGRRRSRRAARRLRTLFVTAVALAGLAAVTVYALGDRNAGISAEQAAAATGALTAAQTFHDFGRVSMSNGIVTYPFRLRNTGSEPALIRELYTS